MEVFDGLKLLLLLLIVDNFGRFFFRVVCFTATLLQGLGLRSSYKNKNQVVKKFFQLYISLQQFTTNLKVMAKKDKNLKKPKRLEQLKTEKVLPKPN